MTVEKTVVAIFEGDDGITREVEMSATGVITLRVIGTEAEDYQSISGEFTLEQLDQAIQLFKKERAA